MIFLGHFCAHFGAAKLGQPVMVTWMMHDDKRPKHLSVVNTSPSDQCDFLSLETPGILQNHEMS